MTTPDQEGRAASTTELLRRLETAPHAYLDGALANPQLTQQHLLILLRNPAVTAGFIFRISRSPQWMKSSRLRAAIARHPKTPRMLAMKLLPTLGWNDLAWISERTFLAPQLRRAADTILAMRLTDMSCGEKIGLARIAGRGLIGSLCAESSPMVIRALLQNPRLREEDVLRVASRASAPAAVLLALTQSRRFAMRREVQKAVARHPSTPVPVALRLIRSIPPRDLRELLCSTRMPTLVRLAAERLLAGQAVPEPGTDMAGPGPFRPPQIQGN